MNMEFSFNANAVGGSESKVQKQLEGNAIHSVKFIGCEIVDIKGVKDPSVVYNNLLIKFENEEGSFTHTIWSPKPEDFENTKNEWKDPKTGEVKVIVGPKPIENVMLLVKHLIRAINPELAAKIDDGSKPFAAKNWEDFRKLVVAATTKSIGASTNIKLMTNKKGEAQFPFFSALGGDGKAYINNAIIGDKVFFSPKENERINKMSSAKPTQVASVYSAPAVATTSSSSSDLDLDF